MFTEIVGQPAVRHLSAYTARIHGGSTASQCFALIGPPGVGKSSSAYALAKELDCTEVGFGGGLTVVDCTQLGVAECDELFRHKLGLSVCGKYRMRCVILEEFEWLSPQCRRSLKFHLDDRNLRPRCCVVATSNKLDGFEAALLSRFKVLPYSDAQAFQDACQQRLRHLWAMQRPGTGLPIGWTAWGRSFDKPGYDMRQAMRSLEDALADECELAVA